MSSSRWDPPECPMARAKPGQKIWSRTALPSPAARHAAHQKTSHALSTSLPCAIPALFKFQCHVHQPRASLQLQPRFCPQLQELRAQQSCSRNRCRNASHFAASSVPQLCSSPAAIWADKATSPHLKAGATSAVSLHAAQHEGCAREAVSAAAADAACEQLVSRLTALPRAFLLRAVPALQPPAAKLIFIIILLLIQSLYSHYAFN